MLLRLQFASAQKRSSHIDSVAASTDEVLVRHLSCGHLLARHETGSFIVRRDGPVIGTAINQAANSVAASPAAGCQGSGARQPG